MRQRLAAALGSPAQDQSSSGAAFAASGGDIFPVADQPSIRPVPQPDSYRASPFAAPGIPPPTADPYKPHSDYPGRDVSEEMLKLDGVIDTSKLNDTPLWNQGGMSLDDVRKSHPPIAPLFEKYLREATEAWTLWKKREGMSEADARQEAEKEWHPSVKQDGYSFDPPEEMFPDEWGVDNGFDASGQRPFKTRNLDFSTMGKILRDLLEERWPGAMPEGYQEQLDDLLQDHQYDEQGKRIGPISMQDGGQDFLLSSVYRRNMSPAA